MKIRPWVKVALAAIVSFSPVYLVGERIRALRALRSEIASEERSAAAGMKGWTLESTSEPDVKIIRQNEAGLIWTGDSTRFPTGPTSAVIENRARPPGYRADELEALRDRRVFGDADYLESMLTSGRTVDGGTYEISRAIHVSFGTLQNATVKIRGAPFAACVSGNRCVFGAFILPESVTLPILFSRNVFDMSPPEIKYSDWPPWDDEHEGYGAKFDIPNPSLWQCHGGLWRRMETR